MPYAEAGEARVCYEVAGEGPRLLFISGSGGGMWPSPELAAAVRRRFTTVALDRRGLGETVAPDGPWTMADFANDAAAVLDAIGWQRCRVLGVSFGGMVAQEFALRYPQRVERLALVCTSSGGAGGSSYPLIEFADLSPEQRALRMFEVSDVRHGAPGRPSTRTRCRQPSERRRSGCRPMSRAGFGIAGCWRRGRRWTRTTACRRSPSRR